MVLKAARAPTEAGTSKCFYLRVPVVADGGLDLLRRCRSTMSSLKSNNYRCKALTDEVQLPQRDSIKMKVCYSVSVICNRTL